MEKRGLKSEDHPDVILRVFKIKLDCLMKELNDRHIFGRVKGVVYTIEFQKRGFPHCHILLWLETEDKITTTGKIKEYISAEIPNKDEDPELYQLATDHMMHGSCGADNPSCPCTIEYKCTKKFPRQFNETIVIDDSGYVLYKRRNDNNIIKKSGTDLHNGYVVPYNPGLLRRYQAHINVEWCNQVGSVKYLFKYINKGPDRVSATVDGEKVDKIKDFLNCRYLSACEATWCIYGFEIHYRTPSVDWFPFHLKDEQHVIFDATESIDYAVDKSSVNETKFEKTENLDTKKASLTTKQKGIYSTVMDAVDNNKGGMFFVYGYGGTGKTYLYKTMSAALHSKGDIVLNVASSGIAALLLEGGRIAHSRFAIPINVVEDSMCHIAADSDLADLIRKANLIIWDEAPMINRNCYEAFDRTLRDIYRTNPSIAFDKVFGRKVVLFGGDFRQILPVITNGDRQDVVNATINSSYLWEKCTVLRLTVNMRVSETVDDEEVDEIKDFLNCRYLSACEAAWRIYGFEIHYRTPSVERLPFHLKDEQQVIFDATESIDYAVDKSSVNETKFESDENEYESSDSVCLADEDSNFNDSIYTTEFLNCLRMSSIPNHSIKLKIGTPIMLIHNINQRASLCNETRLPVLRLGINVTEAQIISGGSVGTICTIPHTVISPTDTKMPFKLNRR
nr:ATP-dependent DNA helicase PIF1-like [Tanacetum cinerariifolium]